MQNKGPVRCPQSGSRTNMYFHARISGGDRTSSRGVREWLSCSHSLATPSPIQLFPFPHIFIPTVHPHYHFSHHLYSHSHPFPFSFSAATMYKTTLKPRNMYIMSWIQNKIWSYSRSIENYHHCSTFIRLSMHVTVQKQYRLFTPPVGILLFTYKICHSH